MVLYAIFQPCLVIYGGQFPQLEEQIVPGSESATFRNQTDNYLSWYSNPSGEEKGETKIGYRETRNSTTATLVILRVRSKAPIHGIDLLRPHLTDDDAYYYLL